MTLPDDKRFLFADIRDEKVYGLTRCEEGRANKQYFSNIAGILLTEQDIQKGIIAVSARINDEHSKQLSDKETVLVTVLHGAMMFSCDLMRKLEFPFKTDTIAVSSYEGTETTGSYKVKKDIGHSVAGKNVIVVEDIVDTGGTLDFLVRHIQAKNPATLCTVALLDKIERRSERFMHIAADYTCFRIPDAFVIGYGLDYNGHYRGMPFVAVKRT